MSLTVTAEAIRCSRCGGRIAVRAEGKVLIFRVSRADVEQARGLLTLWCCRKLRDTGGRCETRNLVPL